jgi:hypothetical protein
LRVLGSSSDDILKKYGITPVPGYGSTSSSSSSSSSSKPVPIKQQSSGAHHAWVMGLHACMHVLASEQHGCSRSVISMNRSHNQYEVMIQQLLAHCANA